MSYRRRYSNARRDPRILTTRRAGKCTETGADIPAGTDALWYPVGKKLYSLESDQAARFRAWQADLAMGHDY